MQTSYFRSLSSISTVAAALLMGVTGCGADASNMATSSEHASRQDPSPSGPSTLRGSQLAPQDPPPPRPSTQEACAACHGIWGAHGIEDVATCICKTHDEGHDCLDGNDCEGECLLDDDAVFHVMDQGDPPRGYYQGSCASYDTTFGCFRHIPDDIGSQLPLTSEEAGPFVCVD